MENENSLQNMLVEVAQSIKDLYSESTVMLFGSYARGEATEDSDIDICVLVPNLIGRKVDMQVEVYGIAKHKSRLPLDLLIYTHDEFEENAKWPSRIQHRIKQEGVVISA
ncbi:MAG: nucleotidyltransferase domain-containing protein [Defluviitaleaceae bacterium]|nr:nucleotidyltransferase domain-containing protein [Defluviitaleaceae bacterium]